MVQTDCCLPLLFLLGALRSDASIRKETLWLNLVFNDMSFTKLYERCTKIDHCTLEICSKYEVSRKHMYDVFFGHVCSCIDKCKPFMRIQPIGYNFYKGCINLCRWKVNKQHMQQLFRKIDLRGKIYPNIVNRSYPLRSGFLWTEMILKHVRSRQEYEFILFCGAYHSKCHYFLLVMYRRDLI